jgi:uroporphyrinogen decarboxylase
MSERENILRLYRHEPVHHIPELATSMMFKWPINGFWERPPYNRGGKDWFEVDWIYGESADAPVPDHIRPPMFGDIREWRDKLAFPDLDAWDWEKAGKIDKIEEIDRESAVLSIALTVGPFERLHALMGFEEAMIAMVSEPDVVADFFDALMAHKCRLIDQISRHYRPDIIHFHDDWGTQKNLFFSPEVWRKLLKPQIKKAADACHKNGVFFEMHSCGRITGRS